MLKKLDQRNVIKYFVIFGITLLFCQNFLQMHYSSDTYVLYDLGYMAYPAKYFLLDGRLISTLVCYIAGLLKIPIPAYIIGMDFLGIVFLSMAIYFISEIFESMIKPEKNIVKICLIASCFVLILNQFVLEYLLFPESAVMCLGVLLNVIAIKIMFESPKHKYLKIFFVLLFATLCYQGVLNMFPVLAMLTYIVKEILDKREYKIKEKEFFIEMIKLAMIVMSVLAICLVIIKICNNLLDSRQDRRMHLVNLEAVYLRGKTVLSYLDELWIQGMHMLPPHTGNIVLGLTISMLMILKTKREMIMQYILLLVIVFTICTVPMFIFNTGICGRVNVPLMMIWGTGLIVLLTQAQTIGEKKEAKLVYGLIMFSFIINNIFIMQNITEHIASNRVEENMGKTIKRALENYEQETGITVTKFGYIYDIEPQQHATGIKPMQSFTERKLACSWSIRAAMNFYCERKFEPVGVSEKAYNQNIFRTDYTEFSEEQIIFDEDRVYLVVY